MKPRLLIGVSIFLIAIIVTKPINAQQNVQNLNISFLLDLSDRINPKKNPGSYQRDLQHIKSVESAFINHLKTKKVLLLNDQMQIFFDPIPKIQNINNLSERLKININAKSSKKDILNVDEVYSSIPSIIYKQTIKDNHYVGSDIWRFFKNNVRDYCIRSKYRNILIIITDGYMFHPKSKIIEGGKSSYITSDFLSTKKLITSNYQSLMKKNNFGFIPFPYNLKDLEILVIGINPLSQNPYEEDVIKKYWSDWFRAMKVKKFYLQTTDLPASIDPMIQEIILNKQKS